MLTQQFLAAFWNAERGEVIPCDSIDISIAVATEKVHGGHSLVLSYVNGV